MSKIPIITYTKESSVVVRIDILLVLQQRCSSCYM